MTVATPKAPSRALLLGLAIALLGWAWGSGRHQSLRPETASALGILRGTLEADTPLDQGVILGETSVLELPAIPAESVRVAIEVEAVRARGLVLKCPDGEIRKVALDAHVPLTLECDWRKGVGGRVELTRAEGRGRVTARAMSVERSGAALAFEDVAWLISIAILIRWLLCLVGYPQWSTSVAVFLVAAGATILAPRVEFLSAMVTLCLPLAIVQSSRVAAARSKRWALGLITLAALAKLSFAVSCYTEGDTDFHLHRLQDFVHGDRQTRSVAPGLEVPLPVPYPSGAYALLSPFGRLADDTRGPRIIGLALWSAEALSLIVIVAIARKAGLSPGVAMAAAAMYAVLPEGVLVMLKGILANAVSQIWVLLTILCLLPPVSTLGLSVALLMTFLTHLGATLNMLIFLGVWAWLSPPSERRNLAVAFLAAAIGAWLLYYRGASEVALEAVGRVSTSMVRAPTILAQSPLIRAGKIVQSLFLELGALPFLLLKVPPPLPEASRRLFHVAFLAYLVAAALAIASPVTLRFELFTAPLLCLFAASVLSDRSARHATAAIACVSTTVFLLLRAGRLEIINFILESPRWPMILNAWTSLTGR